MRVGFKWLGGRILHQAYYSSQHFWILSPGHGINSCGREALKDTLRNDHRFLERLFGKDFPAITLFFADEPGPGEEKVDRGC